ncbi:MAG TPA: IS1182 family transposase [Bacteroidales bacterium]|nr:IS1182 family transposase [Bacteroidales bacterium]
MKRANVKFKEYAQNQIMLIPPTLDEMIASNHPVRIVSQVIDRIDIDPLMAKFKGGGTSSYHPRMLLKVLVFSYLSNIYSGRRMEAALKENIHFMWISGMNQPDHNTINRFRSNRLQGVLKQVFGKVVELLVAEGLVSLKEVYIDGTKIESKANKYTFVWGRSIKVSRERIKKQLEELWQYTQELTQEELKDPSPATFEEIDAEKVTDTINKINEALKEKPVSKKVSQKLKYAEKNWPKNLEKYDQQEEILQGRNSYSKTDPDATFMRMKEDHMLNGQLKPGYNWQISTFDQFILNYSIHQSATDTQTLTKHLGGFRELYGHMPGSVTADAGYGSEANFLYLEEESIRAFVKDNYFDKDQHGPDKRRPFVSDMLYYNEQQDCYYCPMGQPMTAKGKKKRTDKDGIERIYSYYQAQNCEGCPVRGMCHKAAGNRVIEVNHRLRRLKAKAREMLLSEEGIEHRKKRPCDVEPVFGNVKYNKGFKRFMLTGCNKVEIEAGLLSIAHNLKKWSC